MTNDHDSVAADPLALMRLALRTRPERLPACSARRRDNRGRVVANCSFHPGHENDHRDVHGGHTWK